MKIFKQNSGLEVAEEDKRTRAVKVLLSEIEVMALDQLCELHGIKRATYLRSIALSEPPKVVPEVNRKLLGDLGRIGNNLNQLAKAVHSKTVHVTISDLEKELADLRLILIGEVNENE